MKNKWLIASILAVALICLCMASLFAAWQGVRMAQETGIHINPVSWSMDQVTVKATEEKSLKVSGTVSLDVETYQGNITVKAGKAGQITIKADKTAWGDSDAYAQASLKDMTIVIDQSGNTIKVSVDQAVLADMAHLGSKGGQVDFMITVPVETAATLNSSLGNLSLSGTTGVVRLKTEFGSLAIADVSGEVDGHSSNGEITAKNIKSDGVIKLSSDFGAILVDNINGSDVTISTSNGKLDQLKNLHVVNLLKITSEFGDIKLISGDAKTAEIKSNNGAINLEKINIVESISVKSDFGNLTMKEINASVYDLNTQNGKIDLDGAQNTIKAHSDFGRIDVLNAKNATVDLSSNNGAVTFSGALGSGPHTVSSDFGNIQVTLPAASMLKLDLETDSGKITSNFNITINGTMESNHWNGTINGGGAALNIKTRNGNITLQSSK